MGVALPTSFLLLFAVRMGNVLVTGPCLAFSVLSSIEYYLLIIILSGSLITAYAGVGQLSNIDVLFGLFATTSSLSSIAPFGSTLIRTESVEVLSLHSSTFKSSLKFAGAGLGL